MVSPRKGQQAASFIQAAGLAEALAQEFQGLVEAAGDGGLGDAELPGGLGLAFALDEAGVD